MAAVQVLKRFMPFFNRVLVERVISAATTKSGIVLPESVANQAVVLGKVLAVGPGGRNEAGEFLKPAVNVGDSVLLPGQGGTKIKIDAKDYLIYHDTELLGKFE